MPRTFVWHRARGPKTAAAEPLTKGQGADPAGAERHRPAARMRATLEALGLKHHQEVVKPDSPSLRGMIKQVRHLVR